jgi:hypothetical protein
MCNAPYNWGKNVILLVNMALLGMRLALAVGGATTRTVFETYVEKALVFSLRPGQVVVAFVSLGSTVASPMAALTLRAQRAAVNDCR